MKRKDVTEQKIWACPKCGTPNGGCACRAGVAVMSKLRAARISIRLTLNTLADYKSRAAGGDE